MKEINGLRARNASACMERAQMLAVRRACLDDAMDILRWRNDPVARAMSRHNEPINESDHMAWYSGAVVDPNRLFLVGILDGMSIGIVRFDNLGASMTEVSITVAPEARGKGLGGELLRLALQYLHSVTPSVPVLAVARMDNNSSLRLFQAQGFIRDSDDGVFANLVLPT